MMLDNSMAKFKNWKLSLCTALQILKFLANGNKSSTFIDKYLGFDTYIMRLIRKNKEAIKTLCWVEHNWLKTVKHYEISRFKTFVSVFIFTFHELIHIIWYYFQIFKLQFEKLVLTNSKLISLSQLLTVYKNEGW